MSAAQVHIDWKGNMEFEAHVNGHTITLDAPEEKGGHDNGPRPKPLMLVALAGCTGMDVVSILKKMRVDFDDLRIYVEADQSEEQPIHYTAMRIIYEFKGKDLPLEKLQKAVSLSEERYCGVSEVYRKAMPVTTEIRLVE